jgi:hypothetical protein
MLGKRTSLAFVMVPLALAAVIISAGCGGSGDDGGGDDDAIVTKAEYDQIQIGMTYDDVVAIIGSPATMVRSDTKGNTQYDWTNPDGTWVYVIVTLTPFDSTGKVTYKGASDDIL